MLNQYRRAAESLDSKVSSNNIQSFNLHNTALWLSIDPGSEDLSVKGCVPEIPGSNEWFKNTVHTAFFLFFFFKYVNIMAYLWMKLCRQKIEI